MIAFPQIDPIIFEVGPLAVRWYGLMYSLAFLISWPLLRRRAARRMPNLTVDDLGDIMVWTLLGIVIGGRIGYIFFYHFDYYSSNPLAALKIWQGGMSFHGGLLGGIAACILYSRRCNHRCLDLADLVFPLVPIGLFLGRIGNFINGELWGRPTDLPWAMVFPAADDQARHPSQLYEAFLEGIVLFIALWLFEKLKPRGSGALLGAFLIGYAGSRFLVEFAREPDAHLGTIMAGLSMGQLLSLPMIAFGFYLIYRAGPAAVVDGKATRKV
ncbi:MAG: prolipoprotein diacylglyceryl transferase [Magnetococcales bacterium]|nr:prolipoprotein diacylglyceryl transferase [Magnetococcales bacterium]